ncbi:hypothetical protein AXY46_22820 [Achromobacter xylosoxidans]|nr:hypothetical protein AXY46_22820 [Achromobacter xylosoxidans]
MYIVEVVVPGAWPMVPEGEAGSSALGLLDQLKSSFLEANVALNMFEEAEQRQNEALQKSFQTLMAQEGFERRRQISEEVEVDLFCGGDYSKLAHLRLSYEDSLRVEDEANRRFKREMWRSGRVPGSFLLTAVYICAKAFLHALDSFDKSLKVLVALPGMPAPLLQFSGRMKEKFPNLREVRNSEQHTEDRVRRLGPRQKGRVGEQPMVIQPVEAGGLHISAGSAVVLSNLSGNRYGCTLGNGSFGEVEISRQSLCQLSDIYQSVLNSFEWKGSAAHIPGL